MGSSSAHGGSHRTGRPKKPKRPNTSISSSTRYACAAVALPLPLSLTLVHLSFISFRLLFCVMRFLQRPLLCVCANIVAPPPLPRCGSNAGNKGGVIKARSTRDELLAIKRAGQRVLLVSAVFSFKNDYRGALNRTSKHTPRIACQFYAAADIPLFLPPDMTPLTNTGRFIRPTISIVWEERSWSSNSGRLLLSPLLLLPLLSRSSSEAASDVG
jgi:hypothetical protein